MAVEFIPIDRDTPYLFPPSVQDYLPEDHLARFVVEIVDQLDLNHLSAVYTGRGSKPFHPAMLVSLLFYGYATGVFSSRKLEKASYDSIAFRYICANSNPDHDTIASFRKRFLKELAALFVEILAADFTVLFPAGSYADPNPAFPKQPNPNAGTSHLSVYGTVIPEPTSLVVWGLLASVGLCIGWRRRRRAA